MNVLQRPTYTSTVRVSYAQWLLDNDEDLRDWYQATAEWAPEEKPADFAEFCAVQFDIARDLDERIHDGLYEAQLAESDAEDEP